MNTACVPLLIALRFSDDFSMDILSYNLLMIFIINALWPIYWACDPFVYIRILMRSIIEKKYARWKEEDNEKTHKEGNDSSINSAEKEEEETKYNYRYTQRELN